MKQKFTLIILLVVLFSCKKEISKPFESNSYLQTVKSDLIDSMPAVDYGNLDFSRQLFYKVDSLQLYLVRIPLKGKAIQNDFVLAKTNAAGKIEKGKIIHLEGKESEGKRTWNGMVSISSLNGRKVLQSNITNGYIEAFHPGLNTKASLLQGPDVLPEVIIVAYVHNGISLSDWVMLESLINNYSSASGGYGGYYGSMNGGGGGGSGSGNYSYGNGSGNGTSTNGSNDSPDAPLIQVNTETYVSHPAIDLEKYLKCFDNIPDDGATCSIEIFTDLPVDNDPTKLFDWKTESPGHTFLQIKKSNGGKYALQNIGFYPNSNWKNILDADPVDSKIVDDGGHEFHASLKMNLTPDRLHWVIDKAKELSTQKYDMDEFNCTDFAMEVFNYARNIPLDIPRYGIPGGIGSYPSRTPQGLYVKLKEMHDKNDPEAGNITIGIQKGWVADSDGPCN